MSNLIVEPSNHLLVALQLSLALLQFRLQAADLLLDTCCLDQRRHSDAAVNMLHFVAVVNEHYCRTIKNLAAMCACIVQGNR